jgi:hypothetical protein
VGVERKNAYDLRGLTWRINPSVRAFNVQRSRAFTNEGVRVNSSRRLEKTFVYTAESWTHHVEGESLHCRIFVIRRDHRRRRACVEAMEKILLIF